MVLSVWLHLAVAMCKLIMPQNKDGGVLQLWCKIWSCCCKGASMRMWVWDVIWLKIFPHQCFC